MAKKFGNTWWGEQWLNSLSHIDYGNRLPRGARYARNGSVRSIDINNGMIESSRNGTQSYGRNKRDSFRPMVESGCGGTSH